MLVDQIRAAAMAAPRVQLPEVAAVLWRAYGAGQVSEADAEELSALIEIRKALPKASASQPPRLPPRPRSSASVERRRSWTTSGRLPPAIAARVTPGEAAVLSVIAAEVRCSGDCRWPIGKIAAIAGVSASTVKRAVRVARELGLVAVEERRVSAWRNDANILRITSAEWLAWLRIGGSGGGVQNCTPTTKNKIMAKAAPERRARRGDRGGGDGRNPEWGLRAPEWAAGRRFAGPGSPGGS